jgi:hypothetical protein
MDFDKKAHLAIDKLKYNFNYRFNIAVNLKKSSSIIICHKSYVTNFFIYQLIKNEDKATIYVSKHCKDYFDKCKNRFGTTKLL